MMMEGAADTDLSGRILAQFEIEQFLFDEADILDHWRLDDWFALFEPDATYIVPATDNLDRDPELDLALVSDNITRLEGRISRLKSTWAHIENPASRTSRHLTNIRIVDRDPTTMTVECTFLVHRARRTESTTYAGHCRYRLRRHDDGSLGIVNKTVYLVHQSLVDSGGVLSIIL